MVDAFLCEWDSRGNVGNYAVGLPCMCKESHVQNMGPWAVMGIYEIEEIFHL